MWSSRARAAANAKRAATKSKRAAKSKTKRVKDIHVGHKTTGHEHRVNAPKGW
jgi:hypothetical protein